LRWSQHLQRKVTRGASACSRFRDIGLDGDAFLYVSDVFENLEDYDPVHSTSIRKALRRRCGGYRHAVEVLPGETLAHATSSTMRCCSSPLREKNFITGRGVARRTKPRTRAST